MPDYVVIVFTVSMKLTITVAVLLEKEIIITMITTIVIEQD